MFYEIQNPYVGHYVRPFLYIGDFDNVEDIYWHDLPW